MLLGKFISSKFQFFNLYIHLTAHPEYELLNRWRMGLHHTLKIYSFSSVLLQCHFKYSMAMVHNFDQIQWQWWCKLLCKRRLSWWKHWGKQVNNFTMENILKCWTFTFTMMCFAQLIHLLYSECFKQMSSVSEVLFYEWY